jgi:ABC-type molybdenum transport system ATPase subunit/photorepair protein PhrA
VEGANGVGKSTLLRLVAGVSVPSRGRVARTAGLRTGYAPEAFAAVAGPTGAWLAATLNDAAPRTLGAAVVLGALAALVQATLALVAGEALRRRAG